MKYNRKCGIQLKCSIQSKCGIQLKYGIQLKCGKCYEISSSSSLGVRSGIADINSHGSPFLSVFSPSDEINGRDLVVRCDPVQAICELCPLSLSAFLLMDLSNSKHFSNPFALIMYLKNFICLSRVMFLYPTTCITSRLPFFLSTRPNQAITHIHKHIHTHTHKKLDKYQCTIEICHKNNGNCGKNIKIWQNGHK